MNLSKLRQINLLKDGWIKRWVLLNGISISACLKMLLKLVKFSNPEQFSAQFIRLVYQPYVGMDH